MQIPKKVKVGDKWYSVEVVEAMVEKNLMGKVYYPEQKIKIGLASTQTGKKFAPTDVNDTFWHELVHAILDDMGYDTLNRNERFVTGFARRLTKAIETAKFND
jgi:DNA-binding HxlR family transcriptional regulator